MASYLLQDWAANGGNPKARLVLVMFRTAQRARAHLRHAPFLAIYLVLYRVLIEWLLCIELPWNTVVGPGLRLFHGQALVVNDGSVIGSGVTLRHSTTLGHVVDEQGQARCPVLGDGVDVGSNVVILGGVTVGEGAVIGAGSVVVADVPAFGVVVGNPARLLRVGSAGEGAPDAFGK